MGFIKTLCLTIGLIVIAEIGYSNPINCNGFSNPELVYLSYVDAITKGDWKLAYSYIEPRKRAKFYEETVFGLLVASSFDAKLSKGLDPIFKDNGFTVNQKNQYINLETDLKKVADWPRLMKQIAVFMEKYNGLKFASKDTILTNISIKDDSASGSLMLNGSNKTITVLFTKSENGWCLSAKRK